MAVWDLAPRFLKPNGGDVFLYIIDSSERCSMNFSWSPFCEVVSICTPKEHWRSQSPEHGLTNLNSYVVCGRPCLPAVSTSTQIQSASCFSLSLLPENLTNRIDNVIKKELNSLSLHVLDSRNAFLDPTSSKIPINSVLQTSLQKPTKTLHSNYLSIHPSIIFCNFNFRGFFQHHLAVVGCFHQASWSQVLPRILSQVAFASKSFPSWELWRLLDCLRNSQVSMAATKIVWGNTYINTYILDLYIAYI